MASADVRRVVRTGAQQEGELGSEGKRLDRKVAWAAEDELEARRARRGGRATRGGRTRRAHGRGHVVEQCSFPRRHSVHTLRYHHRKSHARHHQVLIGFMSFPKNDRSKIKKRVGRVAKKFPYTFPGPSFKLSDPLSPDWVSLASHVADPYNVQWLGRGGHTVKKLPVKDTIRNMPSL